MVQISPPELARPANTACAGKRWPMCRCVRTTAADIHHGGQAQTVNALAALHRTRPSWGLALTLGARGVAWLQCSGSGRWVRFSNLFLYLASRTKIDRLCARNPGKEGPQMCCSSLVLGLHFRFTLKLCPSILVATQNAEISLVAKLPILDQTLGHQVFPCIAQVGRCKDDRHRQSERDT